MNSYKQEYDQEFLEDLEDIKNQPIINQNKELFFKENSGLILMMGFDLSKETEKSLIDLDWSLTLIEKLKPFFGKVYHRYSEDSKMLFENAKKLILSPEEIDFLRIKIPSYYYNCLKEKVSGKNLDNLSIELRTFLLSLYIENKNFDLEWMKKIKEILLDENMTILDKEKILIEMINGVDINENIGNLKKIKLEKFSEKFKGEDYSHNGLKFIKLESENKSVDTIDTDSNKISSNLNDDFLKGYDITYEKELIISYRDSQNSDESNDTYPNEIIRKECKHPWNLKRRIYSFLFQYSKYFFNYGIPGFLLMYIGLSMYNSYPSDYYTYNEFPRESYLHYFSVFGTSRY